MALANPYYGPSDLSYQVLAHSTIHLFVGLARTVYLHRI